MSRDVQLVGLPKYHSSRSHKFTRLTISLQFLGKGMYNAELYEGAADAGQHPKHISIRKQSVRSSDTLVLHLANGGGCAIRFVPAN